MNREKKKDFIKLILSFRKESWPKLFTMSNLPHHLTLTVDIFILFRNLCKLALQLNLQSQDQT